jgi:hypothetical protein
MLLVAAAAAAPLAPTGLQRPGVEASAFAATQRVSLREVGCTGAQCAAVRADVLVGAEVGAALSRSFGLYARGAWVQEDIAAARYAADGFAAGGGARVDLPLGNLWGVAAWAGIEHQFTGGDDLQERFRAWSLDAGALLRAGRAEEGVMGWVGVGAAPWTSVTGATLDGALTVALAPQVPVEAVAGFLLASDALSGPWDDRARLTVGVSGTAGYRVGVTGFLGFVY